MAEDYTDYITQGAIARGLDPRVVLHVVDTEGGRSGKTGDSGTSFGPFQVHVGGTAPGTTAKGLGDEMLARGLNPQDPYQSIDFSLDHAKAAGGFSPDIWHGLRSGGGLAPGEHRWVGAPSGGGDQPLYLGKLEKNFNTGNDLLDTLLAQNLFAPKEDKPTGNDLLDHLLQQSMSGVGAPNQAQPAPDAAKALGRIPQALPPQTVPELSGQSVDIKPMQPLQAAMPMPGSQSQEYGREGLTPPNVRGPEPTPPPIPIPGSQDRNRFFNPNEVAPYNPPGVSDDRQQQAATGNGLLDRILKQLSPIASAQAAETPPAPQPVPATPVAPTPVTPAPARPPAVAPQTPTQPFIEPPAKGQVVPPAVQPRAALPVPQTPVQTAAPPPRQPIPPTGSGLLDRIIQQGDPEAALGQMAQPVTQALGETGKQLLDMFLLKPLEAGARGISGQDEPGTPQAIEDAMAGAQLASAGSIGRGGMGAGPRLPERMEPPPIRYTEAAREAPSEALAPKQPEGRPPATPPGAPQSAPLSQVRSDIANLEAQHQRASASRDASADPAEKAAYDRLIKGQEARLQDLRKREGQLTEQIQQQSRADYGAAQPPIRPPPPGETPPPAPLTPPPDGNGPVITPPTLPDKKTLKVIRQKVQDGLNWIARSRSADAIEAKQFIDSLPPEFQDPGFRARVGRDIERRMIDPNVDLHPDTQRFLDLPQVKKWTDEEHALGTRLRKRLTSDQADELGVEPPLRTVALGHVHRMIKGRPYRGEIMPEVDPLTGRPRAFGGRSMSTSAAGMKHRSNRFVGQDDAGNRVPSRNRLGEKPPPLKNGYTRFYSDGQGGWVKDRDTIRARHPNGIETHYTDFSTLGAEQFRQRDGTYNLPNVERNPKIAPPEKYGDRYRIGDRPYTAREPTMTEIEDNPLPGELPIRYYDDYLLGLVNNVNRMRSVERNLNLLDQYKIELGGAGLWHPMAGKYLHSPPTGIARGQPFNFKQVDLPQLHGWAHPRIADTINDLYRRGGEEDTLDRINHVLIGSMFLLPVGHMRNVGMHYTIGRGLDWAYRNPQLLRSFNEIWHQGPVYQKFIRNNGPAMYPGAADVHGKLVEKLLHDMANDEGWEITAKSLGTTMKKLLPELYKWSARTLWFTNDHLFLARTLENLKRTGHADPMAAPDAAWKQAIAHTKREIPPYEVPDRILGNRGLRRLLMSPVFAFGRYTYDKYRILGENVKEMAGVYGKGMPQIEGAAKALLTLMLAFPVTSALNAALQQMTGNKNAKVYGAGPTTLIRTAGTGIGRMAHVDPKSNLGWMLGMTPGEADFSHALSGILTFTPALDTLVRWLGGGHDPYTGQPIVGQHASAEGMTAQLLENILGTVYPGELALQGMREGAGSLTEPLGFNLAGPKPPSGKGIRLQRGLERGREKHDWFQQNVVHPAFKAVQRANQ